MIQTCLRTLIRLVFHRESIGGVNWYRMRGYGGQTSHFVKKKTWKIQIFSHKFHHVVHITHLYQFNCPSRLLNMHTFQLSHRLNKTLEKWSYWIYLKKNDFFDFFSFFLLSLFWKFVLHYHCKSRSNCQHVSCFYLYVLFKHHFGR